MKPQYIFEADGEPVITNNGSLYQPTRTVLTGYATERRRALMRQVWRDKLIAVGIEPDTGRDIPGWKP